MEDSTRTSVASASSDDSSLNAPPVSLESIKQEKLDPPYTHYNTENNKVAHKAQLQEKSRTKRSYNKKLKGLEGGGIEKPPPKKRGRKSKKELELQDRKEECALEFESTFRKPKNKSPSQQKAPRAPKKPPATKVKKTPGPTHGSVFDKKILAGPHLTMKQVLEYILTDHSYCVPPDPLPAVGSNHQMIRYILGPKNGAKARNLPIMSMLESEERSPIAYHASLSRSRAQLTMSSSPSSPASKLENLLKRSESSRFPHAKSNAENKEELDVEIDIETVEPEPERRVAYDVKKAKNVMIECEKFVEFARTADTGDNWESKIVRTGWTKTQSALFDKVVFTLHAERLARLTFESAGDTEPVLRRASIDKTACRIRRIFGEYLWDTKLTQWLHSVLTEFLNFAYLAIYIDVLQTLKSQCPQLVSRMMKLSIITPLQSAYGRNNELNDLLTPYIDYESKTEDQQSFPFEEMQVDSEANPLLISKVDSSNSTSEQKQEIYLPAKSIVPKVEDAMVQLHSAKNAEALRILLERQWDPFSPDLLQRLKKLSANPVFVVIAPGAIFTKLSLNRRLKQYYRMFGRVGKIVKVRPNNHAALECTSPSTYLEKLFCLAKERIKEVRHCFPDRPLYLVGWGSGSILAARLSVTTGPVDGVVALGFPLHSLKETQDDVLKIFGGIKHPILFVIGGLASNNSLTDMELFRKRLACETSLVVVGSGNENLYVSRDHREKLLITQSYVDKTVMDEIAYFVNLHSKHNQIIATNISMKTHHFSKSQADVLHGRKSVSLLRPKKRNSSFTELENDSYVGSNNEDSRDSCDSELDRSHESIPNVASMKRDMDAHKMGSYDYGYDGPKMTTPSKSSNKRKSHSSYRPDPNSSSSSISSSSCITASKLLQQSPIAKRRMSKPSGPNQRTPMLNQQPARNTGQSLDIPSDDHVAMHKYLNENEQKLSKSQGYPLALHQNEVPLPFTKGSDTVLMGSLNTDGVSDKSSKRKSNSKTKGVKSSKNNANTQQTSSPLISTLTDATPPVSISNPSAADMHKYLIQHQQMLKQYEQTQERANSSHLFKLLSPGAEQLDGVNVSALPPTSSSSMTEGSDLVKVNLIGSQAMPPEMAGDIRTALISKQNLVSNISLPMIRLSKPAGAEENPQHNSVMMSGAPGPPSILASLPTDSTDKIVFRTSDNSFMKINAADFKNLISGGRGIQLFSGMPGSGPVSILVKKPTESTGFSSLITEQPGGNNNDSVPVSLSTVPSCSTPPVPSVTQTAKTSNNPEIPNKSSVETNAMATYVVSDAINKVVDPPMNPVAETESMDVDTEEEMSGLLISSTFSVCPTSGVRVPPSVSTAISDSEPMQPLAVVAEDMQPLAVVAEDMQPLAVVAEDMQPLAVVAEDMQPLAVIAKDMQPSAAFSDTEELITVPIHIQTGNVEAFPMGNTDPSTELATNEAALVTPVMVSDPAENEDVTTAPFTVSDLVAASITPEHPVSEIETSVDPSVTASSNTSATIPSTEVPGPNAGNAEQECPEKNAGDTGSGPKSDTTSTTVSEEDKRKSKKNNPIRRSARLKSGV